MSDIILNITPIIETVTLEVTTDEETANISTVDIKEDITITVDEKQTIPSEEWINLASGWNVEPAIQTTTLPGEVYEYAFLGGSIYYRYIADDQSIDAFYDSYTAPDTLGSLVIRRRITV